MNIPVHFSESLETMFRVKNALILCGSGSGIRNIFSPESGIENFGSGINIRGSATLKSGT
jgi:hypothetical protein